jgi:hypothetical protein
MITGAKSERRPLSHQDLNPGAKLLVTAMERLGFGRFERLQIRDGEPVVVPWPMTVQGLRIGACLAHNPRTGAKEVTLKHQVIELLDYMRNIGAGEILVLEFRHGLPFSMEVEIHRPGVGIGDCENTSTVGGQGSDVTE